MEDVENLVKTTIGEIEKILTTKTVVGEPLVVDGKTLIPLISVGFGFGAGSGSGKMAMKQTQEGIGGGAGGGAGIRPIAVIISDKEGVRIESIKGGFASALEKLGENIIPALKEKMGGQSPKEGSSK